MYKMWRVTTQQIPMALHPIIREMTPSYYQSLSQGLELVQKSINVYEK